MNFGTKLLISGIVTAISWGLLTSHTDALDGVFSSGGRAAGGQDRTGSPISSGTCSACHGGGTFNPSILVEVKDAGGQVVTQYQGGQTYTVEYTVSNLVGSPTGFGFQSSALLSNNSQAGNFVAGTTSNTQVSTLNGRQYPEQQGLSASGFWSFDWTAPPAGSGTVNFYSVGMACNGGGVGGDQVTASQNQQLTELTVTTIDYPSDTYCDNGGNPTPTVSGTTGGTFSASPAGLNIDANTGEINLPASSTGTYTVTYTYSGGQATDQVKLSETYQINNTATICSNETIFLAGAPRNTPGTYTSNLQSVDGCDSVVVTDLTVLPAYIFNDEVEICQGESAVIFGQTQTQPGVYSDAYTAANGCDSIYNVELIVHQNFQTNSTIEICEGDSALIFGEYESTSGVYSQTFQSVESCDSVVNITLDVGPLDVTVAQTGLTLTSNQNNATYQWIRCENNQPIANATNASYTASANGLYAVVVSIGDCSDTSDCIEISGLGLDQLNQKDWTIYPNPNDGSFTVSWPQMLNPQAILIHDLAGKLVYTSELKASSEQTDIDLNLAKGVYQVSILSNKQVLRKQLVIN